jgi:hypothetical protein
VETFSRIIWTTSYACLDWALSCIWRWYKVYLWYVNTKVPVFG